MNSKIRRSLRNIAVSIVGLAFFFAIAFLLGHFTGIDPWHIATVMIVLRVAEIQAEKRP